MVKASDSSKLVRNPAYLFRFTEKGAVVLMNPKRGEKFFWEISGVAAELWKAVDGKRTLTQIKVYVAKKHRLKLSEIEAKTDAFFRKLVAENILLEATPPKNR